MIKIYFSAKCVLRPDKRKIDGTTPIYFSVRVKDYVTRIPSGKSINEKEWDKSKACPIKNSNANIQLGKYLAKVLEEWETAMMIEMNNGKGVTYTKAKEFFSETSKLTFFSFWDSELALWTNSKRENTLKSYRSTLKMLMSFNPKLDFYDLTYDMVTKFDQYMANAKKNGVGGRWVKHKNLKSMCNEAIKKGYLTKNPYIHFKIKASTNVRNFLSIAELKMLINYEVPQDQPFQQKTKDLFLFSCYTGLRYSDVMNLKWENIKPDLYSITVSMTKTARQVTIPLTENAKAIVNKYGKLLIKAPQANVFPQIANQVLNRNIKEVVAAAGIEKNITYHCSRHTLASNLVESNVNIVLIRDILGHARISETQTYAKSLESDLFNTMNKMQSIYDMPHAI
jgi:site-specific recombinase XerD